ncbi:MAG: hypothetical protein ACOCVA_06045, partial [Prolixibacteraceae bacterium]
MKIVFQIALIIAAVVLAYFIYRGIERPIEFEEAKEQVIGLRAVGSEESISVMHKLIEQESAGNAIDFYNYKEKIE